MSLHRFFQGAVVWSLLHSASFADTRGPLITLPEVSYDFGSVPEGQKVIHEFSIRNDGDADLTIHRIAPACGCTASTVSSTVVKPGSAEKIKVEFDTTGFSGSKNKSVSIITNSRERPESTVRLTGTVVRDVRVTPERLEFGDITPASSLGTRTKEFMVELSSDSSSREVKARSFSKFLEVQRVRAEGQKIYFSVILKEGAPKGEVRDRVIVELTADGEKIVNVPVTASMQGDLRLIPAIVSFGIVSGDAPLERRVRFENNSRSKVSIRGISSSESAVSASVIEVDPGKKGVIVVTLDPKKTRGDLKATLDFDTDHPQEERLSLSVYAVQPPR